MEIVNTYINTIANCMDLRNNILQISLNNRDMKVFAQVSLQNGLKKH